MTTNRHFAATFPLILAAAILLAGVTHAGAQSRRAHLSNDLKEHIDAGDATGTTVIVITGRDPAAFVGHLRRLERNGLPVILLVCGSDAEAHARVARAAGLRVRIARLDGPWRTATRLVGTGFGVAGPPGAAGANAEPGVRSQAAITGSAAVRSAGS